MSDLRILKYIIADRLVYCVVNSFITGDVKLIDRIFTVLGKDFNNVNTHFRNVINVVHDMIKNGFLEEIDVEGDNVYTALVIELMNYFKKFLKKKYKKNSCYDFMLIKADKICLKHKRKPHENLRYYSNIPTL